MSVSLADSGHGLQAFVADMPGFGEAWGVGGVAIPASGHHGYGGEPAPVGGHVHGCLVGAADGVAGCAEGVLVVLADEERYGGFGLAKAGGAHGFHGGAPGDVVLGSVGV